MVIFMKMRYMMPYHSDAIHSTYHNGAALSLYPKRKQSVSNFWFTAIVLEIDGKASFQHPGSVSL